MLASSFEENLRAVAESAVTHGCSFEFPPVSSSVGMAQQGWSHSRVLTMWTVLVVVTALGAGVGFTIGETLGPTTLATVEGVAAGAMLTMIASTMIPEAVHLGGSARR